jgi:predicted RNase H-like HicB family nuclease
MASYVAIIHKQEETDFGALFPDFPGCVSAGTTLDEVSAMAKEALHLHVKGMREDGERIPCPSTLEQAMRHELAKDAVACLVVDLPEEHKTIRVNITLPENELKEIDAYARRAGLTRSNLLAMGAKMMMHGERQADACDTLLLRGLRQSPKRRQQHTG